MKNSIIQSRIKKILIILFWFTIWEIFALIINVEIYLPSLHKTLYTLYNLLFEKTFYLSVGASIFRVFAGFTLSCLLGIIIGYFSGVNNFIYELFEPLIIAIRSTPVISIIFLALIWFESTNSPIFVSFLMCFPIMWTNVVEGIRNTDDNLLKMCEVYNIKKYRVIKSVYFYSSLPYIASGMISALGIGWKATAAAEVFSHPKYSIGEHLYSSKAYLETLDLFAWTMVIIILSYTLEIFLRKVFKRIQTY